jgi:hypothetical protein
MGSKHLKSRQHSRHKLNNTFVVNQNGVCRVFDLSSGGFSFGCTSNREIPEILIVDIVDDKGLHLLDLSVKTIWAAKNEDLNTASIYEIIVGAAFKNDLSSEQQSALERLLTFLKDTNES